MALSRETLWRNRREVLVFLPAGLLCGLSASCTQAPIAIPYSYTYVEARMYSVKPLSSDPFVARFCDWLKTHGYTEITTQAEIDAITHSTGGVVHDHLFRKPLDPAVPASFFAVNCDKRLLDPREFTVVVKAERSGQESDHARQEQMIDPEVKAIEAAFPELKLKLSTPRPS